MSLLINESYANEATPLWLSAAPSSAQTGVFRKIEVGDNTGVERIELLTNPGTSGSINSTGQLRFGQVGALQANTQLNVSLAGTFNDLLIVGGTTSTRYVQVNNVVGSESIGIGTLAGAPLVIPTTASDVNSYIFLTRTNLNASTAVGELRIQSKQANNFTVVSNDATGAVETGDLSSFQWWIVNPA